MAEVIRLREFDKVAVPTELLLTDGRLDINPAVTKQDLFGLRFGASELELHARGFVGLIPLNDRLTLDVSPRFQTSDLTRILDISGQQPKPLSTVMRTYQRAHRMYPTLVTLYAEALLRSVTEVTMSGLLREYEWREEVSSTPRGRILMGRTMQTIARGIEHKAAFGWHQRTTDTSANRCLLYATHRLAQHNRRLTDGRPLREQRQVSRQLNRCAQMLSGVTLDTSAEFLRDPFVTGRTPLPSLRRYYRPALDLALTIIGGQAVDIESRGGTLRLPSLVLDMGTIFEAYVRRVLQREFAAHPEWQASVLDGNKLMPDGGGKASLLDEGLRSEATPDIVVATGPKRTPSFPGILDVKYRPAKNSDDGAGGKSPRTDREDIEQIVAYGMSYRATTVATVQPKSHGQLGGWRHLGKLRGMSVAICLFDLGAEDLLAEERRFAQAVYDNTLGASAHGGAP